MKHLLRGGIGSRPWLIVPLCIALHLTCAAAYLIDPTIIHITSLSVIEEVFGPFTILALVFASVLALVPMMRKTPQMLVHLYLWPQQFLLFLSSIAAVQASWFGTYPDGYVPSSRAFIIADQCVFVFLTIAHLTAIWRNANIDYK